MGWKSTRSFAHRTVSILKTDREKKATPKMTGSRLIAETFKGYGVRTMVTIDEELCIGCGSCVEICHEDCIALVEGSVRIDHQLCSTCTQCIAICPQRALSWDHVPPTAFEPARLPTADQLDELLKERRTIRHFRDVKLDRALVQEIASYGVYAPTNNYKLRAVLVDDPAVIEELERINLQFVRRIYNLFYRPKAVFALLRRLTPAMQEKDKVKIEAGLQGGRGFSHAPAIVFIVGHKWIAHSEASAHYALYNMILYAQAKGIGSTISGGGKLALAGSKAGREILQLEKGESILAILLLGYPAVQFENKVTGKAMPLRWIDR
jgi:formate hydrogenlyase subunit 6/NADH:ubiquinone oxidoreductase subunit I